MHFNKVDFPAPLGPTKASRSPSFISKDTLENTWRTPNDFPRPIIRMRSIHNLLIITLYYTTIARTNINISMESFVFLLCRNNLPSKGISPKIGTF